MAEDTDLRRRAVLLALATFLSACSTSAPSGTPQQEALVPTAPHVFVDAFGAAIGCPEEFDVQCRADGLLPEEEAGYGGISLQYAPSTTPNPLFVVTARHPSLGASEAPDVGTIVELPTSVSEPEPLVPRPWSFGAQRHAVNLVAIRPSGRIPLRWGRLPYRTIHGMPQVTRVAVYEHASEPTTSYTTSDARQTYVGPRGGVYHYSASGKKVYEKKGRSSSRRRK